MWTFWNNLGLNLCVVSPTSHIVAILENGVMTLSLAQVAT